MSIALFEAKCDILRLSCAGHCRFWQRVTDSHSGRSTSLLHSGHFLGIVNSFSSPILFSTIALTTWGITSPLLSIKTKAPILRLFLFTSSSLWSVALWIVTPPTSTGSKIATGVRAPVRPTCTLISSNLVVACLALNLYAMAHLGCLVVAPNVLWCSRESTLITAPSIS